MSLLTFAARSILRNLADADQNHGCRAPFEFHNDFASSYSTQPLAGDQDQDLWVRIWWGKTRDPHRPPGAPQLRSLAIFNPSVIYYTASRGATLVSKQFRQEAWPILLARTVIIIQATAAAHNLEQSIKQPEVFTKARTVVLKMGPRINNSTGRPRFLGFSNLRMLHVEYHRRIQLDFGRNPDGLEKRLTRYNGNMCKLVEEEKAPLVLKRGLGFRLHRINWHRALSVTPFQATSAFSCHNGAS